MSTYEPGTVAVITVDGEEYRAVADDKGWSSLSPHVGWCTHDDVTAVRPLVVLDLIPAQVVVRALRAALPFEDRDFDADDQRVSELADQIEAQTKPPRIPEPGRWGVVSDSRGYYWTATGLRWVRLNDGFAGQWADIKDPVLVREGVQS